MMAWGKIAVAGAIAGSIAGCAGSKKEDTTPPTGLHWQVPQYVLPAGDEHYECFFIKVDTHRETGLPLAAKRFSYLTTSNVVHHLVIFTSSQNNVDGSHRPCAITEFGWNFRYAGGTVTGPLDMPPGVATPLKAVETFVVQLHYLNASNAPVTDDTKVDIEFTAPDEPYTIASMKIAGDGSFEIPPDGMPHMEDGTCTFHSDTHVFGMWPHMHQLGTHFTVDVTQGGVNTVPIDEAWNFGDQKLWLYLGADEILLSDGDKIHTTCTWVNTTGAPVQFGESSLEEMCFNFIYYYPAPSGESGTCGT